MSEEKPIKVLIVDDSAIMRQILSDIFRSSPRIQVVGLARDGRDALEKTRDLRPDVITLDVEMPVMSGLEALPGLVGIYQKPVVMVSSLTQEGADITIQALEMGAVDFVPKPGTNQLAGLKNVGDEIISKVISAASCQIRVDSGLVRTKREHQPKQPPAETRTTPLSSPSETTQKPKIIQNTEKTPKTIVLIGISTGGPQALSETLCHLEPPVPPILIVQHMPSRFTGAFADRLNRHCAIHVAEAQAGDRLLNNHILIAPGGRHMRISGRLPSMARIEIDDSPPISGHKPSVDCLFESAIPVFGSSITGIIMTGMGRDGARGLLKIREAGGQTFGQDETTSTVYGMNKAAWLEGAVAEQFPLEKLPFIIAHAWRD